MTVFIGLIATGLFYGIALYLKHKRAIRFLPPMMPASLAIMALLFFFNVPYSDYKIGGDFYLFFLAPGTIALAYPLYKNSFVISENKLPVLLSPVFGAIIALASTYLVGIIFNVDDQVILSMIPKSVTAPIAVVISEDIGGIPELTACIVSLTGIIGGVLAHMVLSYFKVDDDVSVGLAIGTSSHVFGTSQCAERNKNKQVAVSTTSLILTAIATTILTKIIF